MSAQTEREYMELLYNKRAKNYNTAVFLYYMLGFRGWAYRKQAVAALNLQRGDRVMDIGCGTGLNFSLLRQVVGPGGEIIGIDLSAAMLEQAQKRVLENGWSNVRLIHCDAASYQPPGDIDGVISSFAMKLIPGYDQVIENVAQTLASGKRFVILDLKASTSFPPWLTRLGIVLSKPFGVSSDLVERRPWESLQKYFSHTSIRERYMGCVYIATAETAVQKS